MKSDASTTILEIVKNRSILMKQMHRMLQNAASAEDAVQDTMLAAITHWHEFRGQAKLGTWLYRVGANTALMSIRKHKRNLAKISQFNLYAMQNNSAFPSPNHHLEGIEEQLRLQKALQHLPTHYQRVIQLCDLEGKSVEEVAGQLGLTTGGVRTRRLRAHRLLKEVLNYFRPALKGGASLK